MSKTKKGWINIHIDIESEYLYISKKPYPSKAEAEKGMLIGVGIEKVACIEIEYTDWKNRKA